MLVLVKKGGNMGRLWVLGLSLIVGLWLINIASAAQRVVVCEELYQED